MAESASRFRLVRGAIAAVHEHFVQIRRRHRAVLGRIARALLDAFLQQPDQDGPGHRTVRFAIQMIHGVGFVVLGKITRIGGG